MADCLNCGRPAPEKFCPHCGQETRERRAPFRELAREFFDHLSLDSKLPRSLVPLLFRPGRLTEAYLAGQRASYVSPLRMYVFVSLIFFLVFSLNSPDVTNVDVYVGEDLIGLAADLGDRRADRVGDRLVFDVNHLIDAVKRRGD